MSDDGIQVPYNRDLHGLEQLLSGVRRPGDFFVAASFETAMPRLEVEGVGVLSFPVPEAQIHQVIREASRAPFGRGARTLLDESVRKVWQLPPEIVRLGGKSWDKTFSGILDAVADGLGCAETKVSAEFYKLLVYDEGGHFQAHRDTEKVPGMFGTLIVVLPSAHRGGELVIRLAGREVTLELSSAEVSELRVAAFYADCEHEVRPVTSGYRVCLVYNLIQPRVGKGSSRPLTAPADHGQVEAAAGMLRAAFAAPGAPAKLAWLFQHAYSPAGLSFTGLKGEDIVLAKVLRRAAEAAGCAVHLGIVHVEETGPAEADYSDYGGGGWGYDDEAEEDTDFEVIEVSDSRCHVGEWHDTEDRPVDFGDLPLAAGEVLPAGALDDEDPDEKRLLEATGNEGATFERSYHRAALVMWPRDRFADVLLQAGVAAVLPHLAERVAACNGGGGSAASATERKVVIDLARRIIKTWEETAAHHSTAACPAKDPPRHEMLALLVRLGDARLLERFVGGVVIRRFDGSENEALATAAALLGPQVGARLFSALAREKTHGFPRETVRLLGGIIDELGESLNARWKKALTGMAAAIAAALPDLEPPGKGAPDSPVNAPTTHRRYPPLDSAPWEEESADHEDARKQQSAGVDAAFVTGLLSALRLLGADTLRSEAAAAMAAHAGAFDPVTVVVPALAALSSRQAASVDADGSRLWHHAAKFLLARSEHPPVPPGDWKQQAAIRCSCEDCRELRAFARDPVAREHRFRVKKERRQHLHQTIERLGLDMTHVTERQGSPQTLVCTKTRRTFERQCAQHQADIAAMGALLKMPRGTSGETAQLVAPMTAASHRQPPPPPGPFGAAI